MKRFFTLLIGLIAIVGTAGADVTIYVNSTNAPTLWAWTVVNDNTNNIYSKWPGETFTESETINGVSYWKKTVSGDYSSTKLNILLNNGDTSDMKQTANIGNLADGSYYFTYDGESTYDGGYSVSATFLNKEGWTKVCAYVAGNGNWNNSWPGKQITAIDGVYSYSQDVFYAPTLLIFNNGTEGESNSSSEQTPDLPYNAGHEYAKTLTVNYVNQPSWSTVQAYTFNNNSLGNSDSKGTAMTKINNITIDNNDVYSITAAVYPEVSTNILFNNNNWGTGYQTGNLALDNGKTYYVPSNSTDDSTPGTIEVKLSSSGLSSFSSPYGLNLASVTDLEAAYVVSDLTSTSVKLTKITEIPANTGIILKGTSNAKINIPYKADASYEGTNYLQSTVKAPATVADGYAWALSSGEFHQVNAGTIPVFKAYLLNSDVPAEASALSLIFEDETTGISCISNEAITVNAPMYSISGQKVDESYKGIVIQNGKKFINK